MPLVRSVHAELEGRGQTNEMLDVPWLVHVSPIGSYVGQIASLACSGKHHCKNLSATGRKLPTRDASV